MFSLLPLCRNSSFCSLFVFLSATGYGGDAVCC